MQLRPVTKHRYKWIEQTPEYRQKRCERCGLRFLMIRKRGKPERKYWITDKGPLVEHEPASCWCPSAGRV